MSTVLFIIGEGNLAINHNDLKAFVLNDDAIKVAQSEEFYRNLLHNHEDDIFILKKDTTIQFSTEKWRESFGYSQAEVDGVNFFTFVHPKDLPFFANEMLELINEHTEKQSIGPFRIKDINGKYKLYMANGIPLTNKKEEIAGIGLILKDVSIPVGGESMIPSAMASGSID
jgi:PAS domain S-box-containing protein